jgi:hypothetical protein
MLERIYENVYVTNHLTHSIDTLNYFKNRMFTPSLKVAVTEMPQLLTTFCCSWGRWSSCAPVHNIPPGLKACLPEQIRTNLRHFHWLSRVVSFPKYRGLRQAGREMHSHLETVLSACTFGFPYPSHRRGVKRPERKCGISSESVETLCVPPTYEIKCFEKNCLETGMNSVIGLGHYPHNVELQELTAAVNL